MTSKTGEEKGKKRVERNLVSATIKLGRRDCASGTRGPREYLYSMSREPKVLVEYAHLYNTHHSHTPGYRDTRVLISAIILTRQTCMVPLFLIPRWELYRNTISDATIAQSAYLNRAPMEFLNTVHIYLTRMLEMVELTKKTRRKSIHRQQRQPFVPAGNRHQNLEELFGIPHVVAVVGIACFETWVAHIGQMLKRTKC